MAISLIVPTLPDAPAGGQAYNRRLIAALATLGQRVDVREIPGTHPTYTQAARDAAEALLARLPAEDRVVIDGLALPAFAGHLDALAARCVCGLIHHPHALEAGLPDRLRAEIRAAELTVLPRLSRIVATSQRVADKLIADFAVGGERIAVVAPGRDAVARSAGSGGPDCAILSIGALVPRKGHDVLLRALARLFDLDWHLRIVGSAARDAGHARRLENLAASLGIASRVRFVGAPDDAALEALWQSADLFALASHWEGFGMATAEALARGLPVAVTGSGPDGSAGGDLVAPETGVVVPPGDHDGMSKAMRRLIFSAELRQEMGEAAWRQSQDWPDWATQAQAFLIALAADI